MADFLKRITGIGRTPEIPSGQYKLDVRVFHHTQVIGDALYLWGGESDDLPDVHNNEDKKRVTSHVQIFDITTGKWNNQSTSGNPPLGVDGYFCTTVDDKIYYFGGYCGHDECFHNSLHELNISTLTWTQLQPTDDRIVVMRRSSGGTISSKEAGQHCLLFIGGFGSPPSTHLPQAQYYHLPNGRVSTNEQNIYDLTTGQWIKPEITGQCMPPNENFVMEAVNNTRAIIFGGFAKGTPSNTLYILDIINHTVHWQTIAKPDLVVQWPEERQVHAASIITELISPILVMIGGVDKRNKTINDCWILDINEKSWTKINLPDSFTEREGHSLSTFIMGPHCVWLIVVGGKVRINKVADSNITMLIELILNDGQWSVGFVLDSNDLTSTDDYQRRVQRQLTEGRREWIKQGVKQNVKHEDKELQSIIQSLQDELRVTRDHYQQQLQQTQQAQHQLQQSQDEIQETRQARDQYQQSSLSLLQRLQQTEQARQDIEQQLEQLRSQQEQPHWVVGREEVIMTQEVLGNGAYGKVKVAVFRGLRVAAKTLHGIIISDYTRDLFSREMDIASRVRHPNLVQFIGATRVGTPIILTEIMATSLYNELQKKALTQSQILFISCDVASALNYLHLWKPDPIIHRDISSPNVLLEPSVSDSFKAKVTDYGAANLQQHTRTDMPGNPAYASPESRYPDDHSPAMDVYSYSVLLMEMILHRPPAMTVPKREEQASLISWPPMSSLIQRCLNRDRHHRPTMIQILDQLKQLKI